MQFHWLVTAMVFEATINASGSGVFAKIIIMQISSNSNMVQEAKLFPVRSGTSIPVSVFQVLRDMASIQPNVMSF